MPLPSVAAFTQIVLDAAKCAVCGKTTARKQQPGARYRFAPEPFDPAIHCDGKCPKGR